MPAPEWMTTAQVAEALGVIPRTVRAWVKGGKLPADRFGQRPWLFRRADVERYARRQAKGK